MREALNAFVIRGISSNIPFQAALLAHPKFVAGDFNTGFIAEQYPKGFSAALVPHDDPRFLLALAAAAHRRCASARRGITGQLPGHEVQIGDDFVVVLTRQPAASASRTPSRCVADGGAYRVTIAGQTSTRDASPGRCATSRVHGEFDGRPFFAQVERIGPALPHHLQRRCRSTRACCRRAPPSCRR